MSEGTTAIGSTSIAQAVKSSHRWRTLLGAAVIVLAGLAVYHNSFAVPFLMDDEDSLMHNPSIRRLWPIWPALSPPVNSFVGGRPVVNLSLAVNYALGGVTVRGYHVFNLAVHLLAGLTLYGLVRRTLLRPVLRERFGASATRLALAVAILWTVHPLQTEAVTYITERCETLMGLFYLLTLYCFIRGADSRRSGWWFTFSVVACFLGMASKEVMVTAPVVVLLYDRTFVSGGFREAWARHWRLYLALASTWVWLGYLMVGLHYRDAGYGLGIPWWAYALVECRTVVHYLWLAVWPHPQVYDYGDFVAMRHMREIALYTTLLSVLVAGVLVELKRRPAIGFLGAWFLVILAPTSSIVPIVGQPMAEHRMYLSLAAVVTLAVMSINALMGRRGTAVLLALAVGLGLLATRRNEIYRTELSIWSDTVAKCPNNARARCNLGIALSQAGRSAEAIGQYEQALRIKPNSPEAHLNLGSALLHRGQVQEAIKQDEEALRVAPGSSRAHYNLGIALSQTGRLAEGIDQYEQALRIDPDSFEAHSNLGVALSQAGKSAEAIDQYQQALRINPNYAEAHLNLGITMVGLGRRDDGIREYEEALRLKPDYAEAHVDLGNAWLGMDKFQEAVGQYEEALRLEPDGVEAHFNLGLALEKLGRKPEAIEHYQQALKLRPDFTPAKNALTQLGASP